MSQDYESIGQASPDVERISAQRDGWQGAVNEPMTQEYTDASDFSFRDSRANMQTMGDTDGNHYVGPPPMTMAGHHEPPMAAVHPVPPNTEEAP
jgi:hypothetical protein